MAVLTTACRRWLVAAGCVALVGIFALVRWALEQPLDEKSESRVRRPSEYEIASGMSLRYRHLHADSVSFKACRMRRRRMGGLVLGGFRVLELEDVSLNLPLLSPRPLCAGAAVGCLDITAVILPIFNQEKRLASALGSLLAQTDPGWIALCVDDGSTDCSGSCACAGCSGPAAGRSRTSSTIFVSN